MGKVTLFFLCVFVAFVPFEGLGNFGDLPSGAKLVGMLLVGAAILAFLTGHPIRTLSLPMVLRVVLVLFSAMSMVWSLASEATLSGIPRIAQVLIFVLLLWEFAVTYTDQVWILRSFLVGMIVPLSMAFVGFHGATRFEGEARFSGGGHDLNYIAYMYSASILFAVYLATNSFPLDRYCRWFYWGMSVALAFAVVLTGSRGGFACMVAASVFAMFLAGVSRRRILMIVQVLALVLLVYLLVRYFVPAMVLNRVATAGQTFEEDPRMRIWLRGLTAFWQNPLLGVGANAYAAATAVGGDIHVAHNTFISVAVELGIVGLAIYLSYIGMLFRAAWRLPRREKLLWLGVLVVWFLAAMSSGSQIDKFSWFLHVMILVQAAAYTQSRAARELSPYPGRTLPVFRGPMLPRPGRT